MDWNWFFSAVAQSIAAIVGLIGAFVIAFLIYSYEDTRSTNNEMIKLHEKILKLKEKIRLLKLDTYNESKLLINLRLLALQLLAVKPHFRKPEEYYQAYDFSIYQEKKYVLDKIQNLIDFIILKKPKSTSEINECNLDAGFINNRKINIQNTDYELDKINGEIRSTIDSIKIFLTSHEFGLKRYRFIQCMNIILIILTITGIILPLLVLPIGNTSNLINTNVFSIKLFSIEVHFTVIKYFILSILFISIVIFSIFFGILIKKLGYDIKLRKKLEESTAIENYSKHFKHMKENTS